MSGWDKEAIKVRNMVDYKEMYAKIVRETEKAINILINVQRECEEMYIEAEEPEIKLLDFTKDSTEQDAQ